MRKHGEEERGMQFRSIECKVSDHRQSVVSQRSIKCITETVAVGLMVVGCVTEIDQVRHYVRSSSSANTRSSQRPIECDRHRVQSSPLSLGELVVFVVLSDATRGKNKRTVSVEMPLRGL